MNDEMPDVSTDKVVRGAALIQAIKQEADRQGLGVKEVAARFELAPSYWFSMCNGNRPIQALHKHRLKLIAQFLSKPFVTVLSMAELIEPEDFFTDRSLDDQLNIAYLKMKSDNYWSTLAPPEEVWDATDRKVKILTVALYERLFGLNLLEKAEIVPPPDYSPSQPQTVPAVSVPAKTTRTRKVAAAA